jgi:hypothetical protein
MTIALSANTPRVSYTVAQGATQTAFTVNFEFFDSADLNFYVDGTKKTISTHYTVSGGNGSTGTVNTTSGNSVVGATGGSTVVVTRSIAFARTTDFPSSGAFEVATLNTELDRFTAMVADISDETSRSMQLADQDTAVSMTLPLKADRVGTVLGFNATTGAVEAGPTIANVSTLSAITGNINTLGGISADITTLAHIEDGTTASNAIKTVATNANAVVTVSQNTTNMTNITNNLSAVQNASANATLAENYAVKVDGAVESSKYSSKAWAIGGTGVTDTAGSGSAKSWAVEADAVDGSEHSSKTYAISGSTLNAGSAKNWALGGGDSFSASATIGNTGLYSAKYWAEQSALSKTEFSNIYQGTHSSDPSGGSVSAGDLYFNSTSNVLKFYTGSAWSTVEAVDTSNLASNGFAVAMAIAL